MTLYKLTDKDGYSRRGRIGETKWSEGFTLDITNMQGTELCTDQVIHAYRSPLIAEIMNPTHANISNYILWKAEGEIVASDDFKVGVKKLTTLETLEKPIITINQRIRFGIYCALEVWEETTFVNWANRWLSGQDRNTYYANYVVNYAAANAAYAVNAANAAYAANAAKAAAASKNKKIDFQHLLEKAISEEK